MTDVTRGRCSRCLVYDRDLIRYGPHYACVACVAAAERERAAEVCRQEKVSGETGEETDLAYNQACDDCARAILDSSIRTPPAPEAPR